MAEWKPAFERGISNFRSGEYEEALTCFNESVTKGGTASQLFDSRAAVHEKLGDIKAALEDARKVVDLAPHQWQGYARCARLFLRMKKPERATKMVDYALERVKAGDTVRKETLMSLKQEIIDFVAAVKRYISLTSYHFGNLPVEITHEVFSLLVDSDHASVLTVASVCNTWRSVALASPSFWATLVLTKKRPVKKAKLWIQRSGGRILDLRFLEGCLSDPKLYQSFQGIRWETLLTLDTQVNIVDIVSSVGRNFSQLDQLRITHPGSAGTLLSLLDSVQTRNLEIRGINLHFHGVGRILNDCHTLSFHAASSRCRISDVIRTILENQNLTTLSMSLIGCLVVDITPSQAIETTLELPKLRQLDLRSSGSLLRLLCNASMPSLVSLSLSEFMTIGDQLADFLARYPTTSLTDLAVSRCAAPHSQITSLLRASPHLRTVTFEGISDINEVVEFLAATQPGVADGPPCPSLEKLDLTSCATLRSGPIVRLVKERVVNEDVVTIGTLFVNYCPLIEPEVRDWLSRNVPSFSCVYTRKKDARWKR
ncbi:hypothetical protein BDM02DRAFT_3163013 [Thelephora ganbajun]|uniref:Uncharacterized protein n=1 Tax=Thelephora ganbajun TaxID=370292 RepID=A0ACB6ZPS1_THEGA|nr:hypothetical protein BDM02DRAFT_3163013 [Thelephora ganbajun]